AGKRVALLKEVAPQVTKADILWNPDHADPEFRAMLAAARALRVQLQSMEVRQDGDFETVMRAAAKEHIEALVVVSSRLVSRHRPRILEFGAENRLPVVGDWGPWARGGGLLDY